MPSLTVWSDILPLNLNELKSAIELLLTKAGASQLEYDFEVSRHFEDQKTIQEKKRKMRTRIYLNMDTFCAVLVDKHPPKLNRTINTCLISRNIISYHS